MKKSISCFKLLLTFFCNLKKRHFLVPSLLQDFVFNYFSHCYYDLIKFLQSFEDFIMLIQKIYYWPLRFFEFFPAFIFANDNGSLVISLFLVKILILLLFLRLTHYLLVVAQVTHDLVFLLLSPFSIESSDSSPSFPKHFVYSYV